MWVPSCTEFRSSRAPGALFRFLLACLPLLSGLVKACSPTIPEVELTLPQKIHNSRTRAVWHGKILKTYPSGTIGVYTAEMNIYCIIKGPSVGKIANITEAGFVPGHCHSSTLTVGKSYVVLLSRYEDSEDFKIIYMEVDATPENLATVFSPCGLSPKYPVGVTPASAEVACPAAGPTVPCVEDGRTSSNASAPNPPGPVHSTDDGHDHELPTGHSDDDGHDHKGHFEGDGHEHKGHYDGDGHDHHGHFDADGNVNEGHTEGDGHSAHHEGDGHDHKGHYDTEGHINEGHHEHDGHDHDSHKNGTKTEPVVSVSNNDGPKSGESKYSGAAGIFHINLLPLLILVTTVALFC